MESASLRIKFTPLIKKLHTCNSKCCLEIVPEVACLQNLDKIQWKQDNNIYEYIIPMTYKIIIKKCKKYVGKCTDCSVHQVYHSCVDLLHTSATNSVDAAGDIVRTFSETLLNKVSADMHKCDMILSHPHETYSCLEDKVTSGAQTYEKTDDFTLTDGKNSASNRSIDDAITINDSGTQNRVMNNVDIQVDSFENVIKMVRECVERSTQDHKNQMVCKSDDKLKAKAVNPISVDSRGDNKRVLSFTPICTVNTEDSPLKSQNDKTCNPNSILISYDKGYHRDIYPFDYLAPAYKPDLCASYMQFDYYNLELYRPEVRIAKFMKLLEDEILPLKCMLNEIVTKFTSLNIDAELFMSLLNTKQVKQIEEIKLQKRQKSNRVMYTIVFDG